MPRHVKIFVAVHLAAIAFISIAAWIVGSAYEDARRADGAQMQLVPIHLVDVTCHRDARPD